MWLANATSADQFACVASVSAQARPDTIQSKPNAIILYRGNRLDRQMPGDIRLS
jgi:hypothetical protein